MIGIRLRDWAMRCACPLSCLAIFSMFIHPAAAEDVVLVEEHWELHVGGPDSDSSSPQVSMVMSPTNNLFGDYFLFSLNYGSVPSFQPGGMQLQHWYGDDIHSSTNGPKDGTLHHDDEVIRWTQRLSVHNSQLTLEIVDGVSQTWGNFGGQGYLKASAETTTSNLNAYRPFVSLGESGVGFAGNRVSSLILTKLRWVTSDGEEYETVAPIDIDADLDP